MNFEFHSETVDLPSKGWFYPSTSPLASGRIELYPMTAKHEDILTSQNLLEKGTVINKLIESLIATKGVTLKDLLVNDRDSLVVAARIMAYGKIYKPKIFCKTCLEYVDAIIDLQELEDRPSPLFTEDNKNKNEFLFELPQSKVTIGFRLLTVADELLIDDDINGMKKVNKEIEPRMTTSLRHIITSVNGDRDRSTINKFVDTMRILDSRSFKEHYNKLSPGLDMNVRYVCATCGSEGRVEVPIQPEFFWPQL